MVVEMDVPRIKDAFAATLDEHSGGPEDVAGIIKGHPDPAFEVDLERFFVVPSFPTLLCLLNASMGEEGILGDSQLHSLGLHDIDRVVEEGIRQGVGGGGEEDAGRGLVLHNHGKGSHVIEMGMGYDDGVHAVVGEVLVAGRGSLAVLFRVHPGIENDSDSVKFEEIAVRTDFVGAREFGENRGMVGHGAATLGGRGRLVKASGAPCVLNPASTPRSNMPGRSS